MIKAIVFVINDIKVESVKLRNFDRKNEENSQYNSICFVHIDAKASVLANNTKRLDNFD